MKSIILYDFELQNLLKNGKGQIRRVCKVQPPYPDCKIEKLIDTTCREHKKNIGKYRWDGTDEYFTCPFGVVGEEMIVKETWISGWPVIDGDLQQYDENGNELPKRFWYRSDSDPDFFWTDDNYSHVDRVPWKSPITMPYEASRMTIVPERIWTERVQEITEEGAMVEGAWPEFEMSTEEFSDKKFIPNSTYKLGFKHLWNSHAKPGYKFADNPRIFVAEVMVK
jgi:hypothetical protein